MTASETLELPRAKKGWRGVPIAEIKLADRGDHWIWAVSHAMFSGDYSGSFSPLRDDPEHRADSRDAALAAASARLRSRMEPRAAEYPDARAILAWLAALHLKPVQIDLFRA